MDYSVDFGNNRPPIYGHSQSSQSKYQASLVASAEAIKAGKQEGWKDMTIQHPEYDNYRLPLNNYLVGGTEKWYNNWPKYNYTTYQGTPVKNLDEWHQLMDARDGMNVQFKPANDYHYDDYDY